MQTDHTRAGSGHMSIGNVLAEQIPANYNYNCNYYCMGLLTDANWHAWRSKFWLIIIIIVIIIYMVIIINIYN